jgi:hypothetical protein
MKRLLRVTCPAMGGPRSDFDATNPYKRDGLDGFQAQETSLGAVEFVWIPIGQSRPDGV